MRGLVIVLIILVASLGYTGEMSKTKELCLESVELVENCLTIGVQKKHNESSCLIAKYTVLKYSPSDNKGKELFNVIANICYQSCLDLTRGTILVNTMRDYCERY